MRTGSYEDAFGDILRELSKKPERENNIYPYPAWEALYYAAKRLGAPAGIMLCTVSDGEGRPCDGRGELEEISEALRESARDKQDGEGIVSRYARGQYLILVADGGEESCRAISQEIDERFRERCPDRAVRYEVHTLGCGE